MPTEAAVDRLAELLPADALEDAVKGLDPDVHHGAGRLADAARGPSDRDGARRRADRASRASPGRRGAEPERPQRRRAQDAQHRSGIGRGPHAARPRRQLRAQTRGHAQTRVGRPWTVIARFAHYVLRWTSVLGLLHRTLRAARTLRRRLLAPSGALTRTARRWTLHLPAGRRRPDRVRRRSPASARCLRPADRIVEPSDTRRREAASS